MGFEYLFFGVNSIYSKAFKAEYNDVKIKIKYLTSSEESFKKKSINYKVEIVDNNLKIKFKNHQVLDPYFEGKILRQNGMILIDGKFKISKTYFWFILAWFIFFLVQYFRWLLNPSEVKDGQFLILFIIGGVFALLVNNLYGRKIIKVIKKDLETWINKID